MLFSEAFRLALQALWSNKLRTILTLIGVVMGVASVIMVITLVQGAKQYVSTKLSGYGADVFTVTRMSSVIMSSDDYFRYQKRKILRFEDYQAVHDNCTECSQVGALLNRSTNVVYNGHSSNNTGMRGYTWTMMDLNNIDIALGRGFTPADEDKGTHDVIIGYDIVDNLMPDGDPIGKELRVDGVPYTVVGVGERQGKTFGQSQDNWVAVPITTYQATYGENDSLVVYARSSGDTQTMEKAEDQVRVIMRSRRHDAPNAEDSFQLETNDTFLDIWKQISQLFTIIVFGLASISLVVGGIVIMNIMLVSVTERTREIGIRKALGAKQKDLMRQFLIESALMATIGGAIGIVIGTGVAAVITMLFSIPVAISAVSVILGLVMAAGTGIFFGVYPASKAAKLDPIVALRSEM